MVEWDKLADNESLQNSIANLEKNGISVFVVNSGVEAKAKVMELIPQGAEVMNMSSTTLEQIGINKEFAETSTYISVRKQLLAMDRKTQSREMLKIGAAPEWAIGSVHAITENGEIIIASQTGSQLPAYAYGATHVIWVAGTQKIVSHLEQGFKRVYEYCLILESERAKKAYGASGSSVNKMLVINKEITAGRIQLVLVKEKLGF
ncbi:MAG: LUD domain-containing protein [Candidatus Margulisbacteria bacterium]|nr:LUD domain-containing protein [Candidatus Margulisiibacteriota bacterium]